MTHFWGGEPKSDVVHGTGEAWQDTFGPYAVLNLGFGWDRTQNVLWRLDHGEMDGVDPKAVVVLIGTNNTSETANARANSPEEIAEGFLAICNHVKHKAPRALLIVMAILPREQQPDHPRRVQIAAINRRYAAIAREHRFTFVDISPQLLQADGTLSQQIAFDYCHLTEKGYRILAEALRPHLPLDPIRHTCKTN